MTNYTESEASYFYFAAVESPQNMDVHYNFNEIICNFEVTPFFQWDLHAFRPGNAQEALDAFNDRLGYFLNSPECANKRGLILYEVENYSKNKKILHEFWKLEFLSELMEKNKNFLFFEESEEKEKLNTDYFLGEFRREYPNFFTWKSRCNIQGDALRHFENELRFYQINVIKLTLLNVLKESTLHQLGKNTIITKNMKINLRIVDSLFNNLSEIHKNKRYFDTINDSFCNLILEITFNGFTHSNFRLIFRDTSSYSQITILRTDCIKVLEYALKVLNEGNPQNTIKNLINNPINFDF